MAYRFEQVGREPTGPLSILSEWAVSVHAFRRNRVPIVKKVLAAALCNSGYSYREVARMLGGMSYIAARDAYFALLTSLPREERKFRRTIAIDGSDVPMKGKPIHLWLARDFDSGEILTFQASPEGAADDGTRFLSSVASLCVNRPNLRLGGEPNHPRGLLNLDLYFQTIPSDSIISRLGRLISRSGY